MKESDIIMFNTVLGLPYDISINEILIGYASYKIIPYQRMTSLYQVTLRNKVVETVTPKNKKVKRWFYIDIRKALDPMIDREEAIVGVPEDKIIRTDFGRDVSLDLSAPTKEYAALMYPLTQVFDWDRWQDGFDQHWRGNEHEGVRDTFRAFKRQVLENFKSYRVPVISLDRASKAD